MVIVCIASDLSAKYSTPSKSSLVPFGILLRVIKPIRSGLSPLAVPFRSVPSVMVGAFKPGRPSVLTLLPIMTIVSSLVSTDTDSKSGLSDTGVTVILSFSVPSALVTAVTPFDTLILMSGILPL